MKLLAILALVGTALALGSPYLVYYIALWTHSGTTGLLTIAVFGLYAYLLLCVRPVRRFVVGVLDLVTLAILGVAISRIGEDRT